METNMEDKIITLEHFINMQQRRVPEATGELTSLLMYIILAAKFISRAVNKGGLVDILGYTEDTNIHGEEVAKLDEFANQVMIDILKRNALVDLIGSEEEENPIFVQRDDFFGKYLVLFDPLDGSSNIDVNINVGTIFSILRKPNPFCQAHEEDLLQPGTNQVCSGYIIYGSSSMFVYSDGYGVHGFTLDPSIGEFILTHENITMPPQGKTYSINEGNYKKWSPQMQKFIDHLKGLNGQDGGYSHRYVGSLVADFHRTLLKGGIFLYPGEVAKPEGKLRLLYECSPLAFIAEQAGGKASDGRRPIMEIIPDKLHQRVPYIVGSAQEVERALEFLSG